MMSQASVAISTLKYELVNIPVEGGELAVASWGNDGPVILAAHGITASHREFKALAEILGNDYRLIAPDLRGRGRSHAIKGPWGMQAHARDMVAILDYFGIPKADIILGHSMGGFVAAVATAEYPARFGGVLMVDGGFPIMWMPPLTRMPFGDVLIEKLVQRIVGPSLTRLDMSFKSADEYRAFWRDHPAFKDDWSEYVEDYIDYDLYGKTPELRPRASKRAVLQDVRTQLFENLVPKSIKALKGPVHFLRAPRGLMNDKPLYKEGLVEKLGKKLAGFHFGNVPDTNHFTIVISKAGSEVVAKEIRDMLAAA